MLEQLLKKSHTPRLHYLYRYIKFIKYCSLQNIIGYKENHHIIPKSFGGGNSPDNIIALSARQHFIAHLLLAKGTNSPKMIKALHKMIYSTTGDVQRDYKINSKIYEYIRTEHAKVVSSYSKNTVTAKQIFTGEIKRIPSKLFHYYKNILYVGIASGNRDSAETRKLKSIASKKPRKVKQESRIRQLAASKWHYQTPKGFCETTVDVLKLYPSFTKNTLQCFDSDAIISNKFVSIHTEFNPFIGKTFKEIGFVKVKKHG